MTFKSKSMIWMAVAVLVITVALRIAERSDLIDGSTGTRAFMVFLGLVVMAYGNRVPKQLKRPRASADAERRTQNALRTVGWSMTVAGLLVSAIWGFAPEAIAQTASLATLGTVFLATVFIGLSCRNASRIPQT